MGFRKLDFNWNSKEDDMGNIPKDKGIIFS